MKRIILFVIIVLSSSAFLFSQQREQIIIDAFKIGIDAKVSELQEQIKFSDEQADKIKKIELDFLLGVQKSYKCFLCNKRKRVEKLKQVRDESLQKALTRGQYIRYEGGSIDSVKDYPVILE